jgi:hypothetical protein
VALLRTDFCAASEAFIRQWMFTPQSDARLIEAVVASARLARAGADWSSK